MEILAYEKYRDSLDRISLYVDPTVDTPDSQKIRVAANSLALLPVIDLPTLTEWIKAHPQDVPVLGLVVGLSREKLKNALKQRLGSPTWTALARRNPAGVAAMLDTEFGLLANLDAQRQRTYTFADVLVARASTRVNATTASSAGRLLEDRLEEIAMDLGLPYATRGRFTGRNRRTAPCDLAVPEAGSAAQIVVAAKAFDSTGSKLTDAVREVEEMAAVRRPNQFVLAVIDGIGWLSRESDLRKIYRLWERGDIDGMYTLGMLNTFRDDLQQAARLRGLLL